MKASSRGLILLAFVAAFAVTVCKNVAIQRHQKETVRLIQVEGEPVAVWNVRK